MKKTCTQIATLTNYQTMEQLEEKYPGKFSEEVIEKFEGSELKGQTPNLKRKLLEQYCQAVVMEKSFEPVKYEYVEEVSAMESKTIEKFDVLVVNLNNFDSGFAARVIEISLKTSKPIFSVLLLFGAEEHQVEAIKYLATLSKPAEFMSKQVYFEPEKLKIVEGFLINTVYGILLGKVTIFDPPLKVFNGALKNSLNDFVAKISPVKAEVAFVNDGNLTIYSVHSEANSGQVSVTYLGSKGSVEKFFKTSSGSGSDALSDISSAASVVQSTPAAKPGPRQFKAKRIDFNTEIRNIEKDVDSDDDIESSGANSDTEEVEMESAIDTEALACLLV